MKNATTLNIRSNSYILPKAVSTWQGVCSHIIIAAETLSHARPVGAEVSNDKFHGATVLRSLPALLRASVANVRTPLGNVTF